MNSCWPNLFVVKNFFEPLVCDEIVAEMRAAESSAAMVYGLGTSGSIEATVRKTLRLAPSHQTIEFVTGRLLACKETIEKHFGVSVDECEDPQFLRYREGDFFVAHQDGNTGMLRLDSERRLISTVIFLSRESELPGPDVYCGGSLVFTKLQSRFEMPAEPGTLVAFRSETTHEVTPVTHGERYSIASWYRRLS
jgi:SM-20-related protein